MHSLCELGRAKRKDVGGVRHVLKRNGERALVEVGLILSLCALAQRHLTPVPRVTQALAELLHVPHIGPALQRGDVSKGFAELRLKGSKLTQWKPTAVRTHCAAVVRAGGELPGEALGLIVLRAVSVCACVCVVREGGEDVAATKEGLERRSAGHWAAHNCAHAQRGPRRRRGSCWKTQSSWKSGCAAPHSCQTACQCCACSL